MIISHPKREIGILVELRKTRPRVRSRLLAYHCCRWSMVGCYGTELTGRGTRGRKEIETARSLKIDFVGRLARKRSEDARCPDARDNLGHGPRRSTNRM